MQKKRQKSRLHVNNLDCPNKCHDTIILILTPHHNTATATFHTHTGNIDVAGCGTSLLFWTRDLHILNIYFDIIDHDIVTPLYINLLCLQHSILVCLYANVVI